MSAAGTGLGLETAVSPARIPIAMVLVGGAAPAGSVLGGFESGGADLIVGSVANS